MHHIFVKENEINIDENRIVVSAGSNNYNHIVNALRVKKGELVLCSVEPFAFSFDYKTKVEEINVKNIVLDIEEKVKLRELPVKINLYQGITKFDKLEFIIEKAVELGAYSVNIVAMDYSIVKFDKEKIKSRKDRFEKIAKSAAEQSKRGMVPFINIFDSFNDVITNNKNDSNILFYENANDINMTRKTINELKNDLVKGNFKNMINIYIGPEGGFSKKEIESVEKSNFKVLTLGNRILRTETAAITALSIMMYEFENI